MITEKGELHFRNRHRGRYDFQSLAEALPELKMKIIKNKFNGEDTIDFGNNFSVKLLNKAILKFFYNINYMM